MNQKERSQAAGRQTGWLSALSSFCKINENDLRTHYYQPPDTLSPIERHVSPDDENAEDGDTGNAFARAFKIRYTRRTRSMITCLRKTNKQTAK